jgi:uncharacterized protein (UPF0548 family)
MADRVTQSVNYAAVGATQAADLLRYPPSGYRPIERRARIGHGADRWEHATREVMTWGVQRGAGMRIQRLSTPDDVAATGYRPVEFAPDGEPIEPAERELDAEYAATGDLMAHSGETVVLTVPVVGAFGIAAPVRVVYVIDEPDRVGFAYGTLPGHPESGEEVFEVSRTEDGSVWLTIRAFSRPSQWWWWAVYPALRVAQYVFTRRYLRALAGPLTAQAG